jgi:hypothetical protein
MADEESLRQVARTRAPFSAWLGVVLLFALFGGIVLAVIGPSPRGDRYEEMRAKQRLEKVKPAREEDAKALSTYAWIDKNKGTARIPIDRAMELTVAELAQKKPAPAYPIAAAPAAPAAASPQASAPGKLAPSPSPQPASTVKPSSSSSAPQASGTPKASEVEGPHSENRAQPAAASNPAPAKPGTQPGAAASPAASPTAPAAKPAASPTATPTVTPPGSPLPVRGATPGTF